jgi:hypothetical protein
MKIAYIVLAHKLPEQLVRLICRLNNENASFFIHVDNKTDTETYRRMAEPLSEYENVYFLERRGCDWGAFNMVEATLDGIRNVLKLNNIQFDYIILLTGQDYPIKSNEQIQRILIESGGQNFIEHFPLPNERWIDENGGLDRFNYWRFIFSAERLAFIKKNHFVSQLLNFLCLRLTRVLPIHRKPPPYIRLFGGSAYWCLTKDCIEHVNEIVQQDSVLVNFFKFSLMPDETFFQTVILNSRIKNHVMNNNLRYIVWNTSSHPEILRKQDFESFMGTDKLFARKFDITIDSDVLDMIDQVIS